jgi:hypothetical protein
MARHETTVLHSHGLFLLHAEPIIGCGLQLLARLSFTPDRAAWAASVGGLSRLSLSVANSLKIPS